MPYWEKGYTLYSYRSYMQNASHTWGMKTDRNNFAMSDWIAGRSFGRKCEILGRFQIVIDEQESNALWICIPFTYPSFFMIYYNNMRKYVLMSCFTQDFLVALLLKGFLFILYYIILYYIILYYIISYYIILYYIILYYIQLRLTEINRRSITCIAMKWFGTEPE
jgi:hypothetical protein